MFEGWVLGRRYCSYKAWKEAYDEAVRAGKIVDTARKVKKK